MWERVWSHVSTCVHVHMCVPVRTCTNVCVHVGTRMNMCESTVCARVRVNICVNSWVVTCERVRAGLCPSHSLRHPACDLTCSPEQCCV